MSQKRKANSEERLIGSTVPTALERTLAPGVALLIAVSLLLVCFYLVMVVVL